MLKAEELVAITHARKNVGLLTELYQLTKIYFFSEDILTCRRRKRTGDITVALLDLAVRIISHLCF